MSGNPNAPRIFLRGLATSREPKQTAEYRHRLVTAHQARCRIRSRARKPKLQKFVPIRVHSWFKKNTHARSPQHRSRARKPELQKFVLIRVHSWFKKHHSRGPFRADLGLESPSYRNSCPFVFIRGSKSPAAKTLQDRSRAGKHELQKFVSIRVHSWFKTTRSGDPAEQISGWKARATKIRAHSCPFVVQNDPQRRPFRTDLGLESPSCKNSCPFVSIRGSKTPRSEDPSGQISG